MAAEIRQYTVTIPAGTTQVAPFRQDVSFPPREVVAIEVIVPPGPNGLVGFNIQNSDLTVIPYDSDKWIVTNDEKISWPLDGYINSGSWQVSGYNSGAIDHSIYVRFLLNLIAAAPTSPTATSFLNIPDDADVTV